MRKYLLLLVVVFVAACGGDSSVQITPDQSVVAAKPTTPMPTFENPGINEATQKERAYAAHAREVEFVIQTFEAAQRTPDEDWVSVVRGSSTQTICGAQDLFRRLESAMVSLKGRYGSSEYTVSWKESGTTEEEGTRLHRKAGISYAKKLLTRIDQKSGLDSCGNGEGRVDLTNTVNIMAEIVTVLELIAAIPADIGTTPQQMRLVVLRHYQNRYRETMNRSVTMSPNQLKDNLEQLVESARRDWNISPDEIKSRTPKT